MSRHVGHLGTQGWTLVDLMMGVMLIIVLFSVIASIGQQVNDRNCSRDGIEW
jgi:hypothetical protein